jgi:thiol-disulfide isomerase/thioredoxin
MTANPALPTQVKKKQPLDGQPLYGVLKFGDGPNERDYAVEVEEPISETSRIYVDSKADGDLTENPPLVWNVKKYKGPDGTSKTFYSATITVDLPYKGQVVPCSVGFYPSDKDRFGYYADFSLQGNLTLGGVKYDTIYWDSKAIWSPAKSQAIVMIDTDHDGKFHPAYEFFPDDKPFNIKGTTYELRQGLQGLTLVKSTKFVKERSLADMPADPNLANGLRPGKAALPFSKITMDGNAVAFPKTYSGKVVMLDFWATWCGPCMREAPNVAKIFAKYHSQGFEVLGVSLDNPNAQDSIIKTTERVGMTWPQIYEGKGWESALVKQYGIKAIPATYLVDGDTGKVLAMLDELRGEKLEPTIKAALQSKHLLSQVH